MTDHTPSNLAPLMERNGAFARTDAKEKVPAIPFIPNRGLFVITCIDSRVDPAGILGLELGDAIVLRNVGGRVTPAALADVAYISYLVETKAPQGPWFEIAVIHHTDCGSGLLAEPHPVLSGLHSAAGRGERGWRWGLAARHSDWGSSALRRPSSGRLRETSPVT